MDPKEMPVVEHLSELRNRLIILLISITAITGVIYMHAVSLMHFLLLPILKYNIAISYFEVYEGFFVRIKISFYAAIILLVPLILYHTAAFINPGLTKKEKSVLYFCLLIISIFFLSGVVTGYLFLMPLFLSGLLSLSSSYLNAALSGNIYFGFVGAFSLMSGFIFLIPALSIILGRLEIISPKQMRKGRKYLFPAVFILQVMIGYSGDLIASFIILLPLIILYEISILIVQKTTRLN